MAMKMNARWLAGAVGMVGMIGVMGVMVSGLMGGCSGAPVGAVPHATVGQEPVLASVAVGDASYEAVFDAARQVLGEYRFALNRVDAARGVITTYPKRTAGLGSPWDREQSSAGQEWEDLVNQQQRVVRVRFERGQGGELARATVGVELRRTHRPSWRVEPESVRLSTHARARDGRGQREAASFDEVVGLDTALARRLALAIERRLGDR